MAQITINVSDDDAKKFNDLCKKQDITTEDAITNFMQKSIMQDYLYSSFKIKNQKEVSTREAMKAVRYLQKQAKKNGTAGMSMEEIDKEIALYRSEKLQCCM